MLFLDEKIKGINQRFENFMSQMNPDYKGRIIRDCDEARTFKSFALRLEVAFHRKDEFRSLCAGFQSGRNRLNL